MEGDIVLGPGPIIIGTGIDMCNTLEPVAFFHQTHRDMAQGYV